MTQQTKLEDITSYDSQIFVQISLPAPYLDYLIELVKDKKIEASIPKNKIIGLSDVRDLREVYNALQNAKKDYKVMSLGGIK
jgi:hypothetical protein